LLLSDMKTLSILGVTGTIGQNCLKVLDANVGAFEVVALTANDNAAALAEAVIKTRATFAAIANTDKYAELKSLLTGTSCEIAAGDDAVEEAAARASDVLLAAIVGAAGLKPTMKAVERGATIALANKECLVCAGAVFMKAAEKHGASIIPVDSEHNAIFQLLQVCHPQRGEGSRSASGDPSTHVPFAQDGKIQKITLTASGGPFRNWPLEQMQRATPTQAVKHPNWHMGAKISVDSATMANKGLELIEAKYLFHVTPEKLDVLVHPESIIHGLVEMCDGSVLAQMSEPDMCIPIAYALGFPTRLNSTARPLNLATYGTLTFENPDYLRFPALRLARESMSAGSIAECVFNAANEVAVAAFLDGRIEFLNIPHIIEHVLTNTKHFTISSLDDALALDAATRITASSMI
jgi:1-deoxy-D-xylulose-5-phosphate reductoisomerase